MNSHVELDFENRKHCTPVLTSGAWFEMKLYRIALALITLPICVLAQSPITSFTFMLNCVQLPVVRCSSRPRRAIHLLNLANRVLERIHVTAPRQISTWRALRHIDG